MTKKKITYEEIVKSELLRKEIDFIRLKDIFNMKETVSSCKIKNIESGIYAVIKYENIANQSIVKIKM